MTVDGAERVVHENDICVKVNGTSDVQTLLLAARDGDASLADLGLVAVREHV